MTQFTASIKAYIDVTVEADSREAVTAEMVEAALIEQHGDARYVTVKNGVQFDHEEFEVIG